MAVYYDSTHKTYYCKFRFTDWTGRSRFTTRRGFRTRREAREAEASYKSAALNTPDSTVEKLIEEKLAHDRERLKESTCLRRKAVYDKYIMPSLGRMQLSKLNPNVIRKWQNSLPKHLSSSTIAFTNSTFCALLNFGVKFFGMPSNPFDVAGKTGHYERRRAILEPEQFNQLIAIVKKPHHRLLFRLLYYSGMRIGEALALTYDDVDFEACTIHINKTRNLNGENTQPKTRNSIRMIAIPQEIIQEIANYRDAFIEPPERIFLFDAPNANALLSRYLEKAGLPHISLHGLRHSHASMLIQQGLPVTAIAARLGHSPKETLSTYAHVYQRNDADIAKLLESFMKK